MIDILKKLVRNELDEDKAHDIIDEVVRKYNLGIIKFEPKDELQLNEYEWTAYCHGLSLFTLTHWRINGWPQRCSKCGSLIDYKKFGWIIIDDSLVGLYCHN